MGYSILELVLRHLREAGFTADAAYPGQMLPRITKTVAAVHIQKVERDQLTVTVEVDVLTPAELGGGECEEAALKVTEILRWAGAVCVQNGCSYDGGGKLYKVAVLATFTGITGAAECTIWPGFYCHVDQQLHRFAVGFTARERRGTETEFVMGQPEPAAVWDGSQVWELTLEEKIPVGSPEIGVQAGEFVLWIDVGDSREIYSGCRWEEIQRQLGPGGIHRVRRGYARKKEVTALAGDAV